MTFSSFAKYLEKLEAISSRNEMVTVLAELLKSLDKNEIQQAMYLMQGRVVPKFIPLEFNFAGKQMQKVLSAIAGDEKKVADLFEKKGDLGLVAEEIVPSKSKGFSINEVYDVLKNIAVTGGKGSVENKTKQVQELFEKFDNIEAKFVTRILIGNLRLGLSDKTVLDAISWAVTGDKSHRDLIERAYSVRSDIGLVTEEVLTKGIDAIKNFNVEAGLPVASKLVERESSIEELFERLGGHIVQPKYDGLRAQIHYSKKGFEVISDAKDQDGFFDGAGEKQKVRIFSRNMENLTDMFPDVGEAVSQLDVDSIVIDSEVIGYDPNTKLFFPFQETSTRRRKYGVAEKALEIPIRVMTFDLLYLNGKDMTLEKVEDRLKKLEEILKQDKSDKLKFSESPVVKSEEELRDKFDKYVELGLEGIISKKLGTIYEPGTRNFDWIKLKFTVQSHIADTIDTVVLGYYFGQGVRAKFGMGALLLGIYNEETNEFESVAKLGTGIKDEDFLKIKPVLDKLKSTEKPKGVKVSKMLEPDVWIHPKIVIEVEADEITKSKNHLAAIDSEGRGLSLRFPRMKIFGRDKDAKQATTAKELTDLFKLQKQKS